jgi:hypothetical protein
MEPCPGVLCSFMTVTRSWPAGSPLALIKAKRYQPDIVPATDGTFFAEGG